MATPTTPKAEHTTGTVTTSAGHERQAYRTEMGVRYHVSNGKPGSGVWRQAPAKLAGTFKAEGAPTDEAPAPRPATDDEITSAIANATFTLTESGVAKVAAHTGETPARVREAARAQGFKTETPADDMVTGTMRVAGRMRPARRYSDGMVTRQMVNGRWMHCTERQALTFTPDEAPAPTLPAIGSEVQMIDGPNAGDIGRVVAHEGHELGVDMKPDEVLVTWKGAGSQVIGVDRLHVMCGICGKVLAADGTCDHPTGAPASTVTIVGTVMRYRRTVEARRTRTGDVYGWVEYRAEDGQWLAAGKDVAGTFQRTMTGEAPAVTEPTPLVETERSAPKPVSPQVADMRSESKEIIARRDAAVNVALNFDHMARHTTGKARAFWADKAKKAHAIAHQVGATA